MPPTDVDVLPLIDHEPDTGTLREDVLTGLSQRQKEIPSKYFYDARGSKLFDDICELEEYYPTRTEMGIMRRYGKTMAAQIGSHARIVEYGSGSSLKTRLLLHALDAPTQYVPMDISREHLLNAAQELSNAFPEVPIQPVCVDYTADFSLPDAPSGTRRTVVYFPGSTIGNFEPDAAAEFLARVAAVAGRDGGLLIGVDVRKDPDVLRAAYDDREGVTADFNRNLLRRINRELEADFNLDAFAHEARWNDERGCIEMHLVSQTAQTVTVEGESFAFEEGETIRTEYSFKYTLEDFETIAARGGFRIQDVWTDDDGLFSVHYATVG